MNLNLTEDQINGQIAEREANFQSLVADQQRMDAETQRVIDAHQARTVENNLRAAAIRGAVEVLRNFLPKDEQVLKPKHKRSPKS